MKKLFTRTALLVGATLCSTPASASVYSDDLGRCLVAKTSSEDKVALVQWVFSAMSTSQAVKTLTTATPQTRDKYDHLTASLFQRLLVVDCRKEAVDAIKYDGTSSIEGAFGLLGQVAFKSLMNDPAVAQSLGSFGKYIDESKLKALFGEAGVTSPPLSTPAPK